VSAAETSAEADADRDPLEQLEAGPIFICGHIRSGTTWVLDLLAAHPQVAGLFESLIFTGNGVAQLLHPRHWDFETSERMFDRRMGLGQIIPREELVADVRRLCDEWFAEHLEPHHRFLVEKTPAGAQALETVAELYPDATVIHVMRDGRDVAISTLAARRSWQRNEKLQNSPRDGSRHLWAVGLGWANHIADINRHALKLSVAFHEVRYEQMHEKPLETARAIFRFCGIPADDELISELLDQVHFSKLPHSGEDQFRRHGQTGEWRTQWNHLERLLFSAAAGETLEVTGYAPAMIPQAEWLRARMMQWEKLKRFM
jgi:hypothetical protein